MADVNKYWSYLLHIYACHQCRKEFRIDLLYNSLLLKFLSVCWGRRVRGGKGRGWGWQGGGGKGGGGGARGVLSRNHEGLFQISRITKKIIFNSFSRFL